jgi:hypothetical protein
MDSVPEHYFDHKYSLIRPNPAFVCDSIFSTCCDDTFAKRDHSLTFPCSHPLTGWLKDSLAAKKAREAQFGTLANFTPAILAQGRATMQRNSTSEAVERARPHPVPDCRRIECCCLPHPSWPELPRNNHCRGRSHDPFLQVFLPSCWRTKSTSGLNLQLKSMKSVAFY